MMERKDDDGDTIITEFAIARGKIDCKVQQRNVNPLRSLRTERTPNWITGSRPTSEFRDGQKYELT